MKKNLLKILPFVLLLFSLEINVIAMRSNDPPDKGELRKSLEHNIITKLNYILSNSEKTSHEEKQKELLVLKNVVEKMLEEVTPFSVSMAQRINDIKDSIENAMR